MASYMSFALCFLAVAVFASVHGYDSAPADSGSYGGAPAAQPKPYGGAPPPAAQPKPYGGAPAAQPKPYGGAPAAQPKPSGGAYGAGGHGVRDPPPAPKPAGGY